jgi:hypothetical protein
LREKSADDIDHRILKTSIVDRPTGGPQETKGPLRRQECIFSKVGSVDLDLGFNQLERPMMKKLFQSIDRRDRGLW